MIYLFYVFVFQDAKVRFLRDITGVFRDGEAQTQPAHELLMVIGDQLSNVKHWHLRVFMCPCDRQTFRGRDGAGIERRAY